jgi:ribulose-phosphate 3-epimerase
MIEIIPTVVPNSLDDVNALLARCRSFSQTFHIDAADGTMTPNTTWVPATDGKLPEADSVFFEAHLMIAHPEAAGSAFARAGAKRVIAHAEAFDSEEEAKHSFDSWKTNGAKEVGIAALIATPLEALEPYILMCDSVTLMTIASVGAQGIPFDERGYGRVADLHARYPDIVIEVDGGVGMEQIAALVRAGASRFSVGSALSKSADPAKTHKELLDLAQGAL